MVMYWRLQLLQSCEGQTGGVRLNFKSIFDFNNCCFNCGLMDLNYCGPRYTWKNGRVQERLDWALANFSWFIRFKEAFRMGEMENKRPPRHFRFIVAWVTDNSFKEMIKDNWSTDCSWPVAISSLTKRIKEWNRDVFGSINKRKRTLTNILSGIDRANLDGTNLYLNQL